MPCSSFVRRPCQLEFRSSRDHRSQKRLHVSNGRLKRMQLSRNQTDPMLLKWKRNHSGCVLLVKGNNFPRRPLLVLWCQRRSSPFLAETRPFQRWQLNACKLATSTSILQSKQSPQLTLTHTHTHIQTHDGRCNSAQTPLLVNVSFISSKNSIVPSKNKNENGKDLQ